MPICEITHISIVWGNRVIDNLMRKTFGDAKQLPLWNIITCTKHILCTSLYNPTVTKKQIELFQLRFYLEKYFIHPIYFVLFWRAISSLCFWDKFANVGIELTNSSNPSSLVSQTNGNTGMHHRRTWSIQHLSSNIIRLSCIVDTISKKFNWLYCPSVLNLLSICPTTTAK